MTTQQLQTLQSPTLGAVFRSLTLPDSDNVQQTRASTVHPLAHDPRLDDRNLTGLSSGHLVSILEELPPKPTFGHLTEASAEWMPVKGDDRTPPEEKGTIAAAAATTFAGEGDDDGSLDAEGENAPEEATDATNPEKLALLKASPYDNFKAKWYWRSAAALANAAAVQASLTRHDEFRAAQKYKALKARQRHLTPAQKRILAARQLNPHAMLAPLRVVEKKVQPPKFQSTPVSHLQAKLSDPASPAATKQALRPAPPAGSMAAMKAWFAASHAPDLPSDGDKWHLEFGKSAEMKKTPWPAPGY